MVKPIMPIENLRKEDLLEVLDFQGRHRRTPHTFIYVVWFAFAKLDGELYQDFTGFGYKADARKFIQMVEGIGGKILSGIERWEKK